MGRTRFGVRLDSSLLEPWTNQFDGHRGPDSERTDRPLAPHPARANAYDQAILAADRRAGIRSMSNSLTSRPLISIRRDARATLGRGAADRLRRETAFHPAASHTVHQWTVRTYLSDILLGERAAMLHALRLCAASQDLGAQEHAANQARRKQGTSPRSPCISLDAGGSRCLQRPFWPLSRGDRDLRQSRPGIAGMQVLVEGSRWRCSPLWKASCVIRWARN